MSERVRFLGDANFRLPIVQGLRHVQPAVDFMTAQQANLAGVPDPQVLALVAEQGRVLVSHDVHTMPVHFAAFLAQGHQSSGLILIQQHLAIGRAVEMLHLVWFASEPQEWINKIEFWP